jgi:hypothetical protein
MKAMKDDGNEKAHFRPLELNNYNRCTKQALLKALKPMDQLHKHRDIINLVNLLDKLAGQRKRPRFSKN